MTGCSVNLWLASEHASSVAAEHSLQKPFAAVRAGRRLGRSWRSARLPVGFTSSTLHGPCSLTPALPVPSSRHGGAGAGAAHAWAAPAGGADLQAPCMLLLTALQQQWPKHNSPLDFFITRTALAKEGRPPPGNIWAPLLIVWQLMLVLKTEGTSDIK